MNDGEMAGFPSDGLRISWKPIKPWAALMSLVAACVCSQAFAQICETERQAAISREPANALLKIRPNDSSIEYTDIKRNVNGIEFILIFKSGYDSFAKELPEVGSRGIKKAFPDIERNLRGLRLWERTQEIWIQGMSQGSINAFTILFQRYLLCIIRAQISVLERGSSPSPQPPIGGSTPPPVMSRESALLALNVSRAVTLAKKRQADLDQARQGRPKRHQAGLEAHQCLQPQAGGGVVNACPYAIEYVYCVYRPTRGSDSGFMDCEKNGGGMWHIGAGPNSVSIMHTSGETTYWFACKYGETLDKPNGGSVVDAEFQAGRGIVGRCT